jgi:hypothetical protein
MDLRDLFASDDEEQKRRVDGPSIREFAASASPEVVPGQVSDREVYFTTRLPGDDVSNHPDLPPFNPYLFVPLSELVFLLKKKRDLSAESRTRIAEAIRRLEGA